MRTNVYDQLQTLGISLPPVATPAAAYLPFMQAGSLVFLSGHIAKLNGQAWVGQLGLTMDTATGQAAARAVCIDLLGTLHAAVGDLNRVKRIVKVMSLVNSTASYTEQHLVKCLARVGPTPAVLLVWRNCHWALALRLN
jgi:enamine deaminase RidA (YjgF/YER057c/UK114 family)